MALVDANGEEAVVGKSEGYWLAEEDFFSTQDGCSVSRLGALGFPRDWPAVYSSSKQLKSLIGKKGRCAGKKVGVVAEPMPDELDGVRGVALQRLQSFANAEAVQRVAGFQIVTGWAVFEHLDLPVSAAFVAERYWWNALPDGKWVDFTPRPRDLPELLLAEAAGDASKSKTTLRAEEHAVSVCLFKQRFAAEFAALSKLPPPEPAKPATPTADSAPAASKSVPAEPGKSGAAAPAAGNQAALRQLAKRVQAGEVEAMRELEELIKGNEETSMQVADMGITPMLAKKLGEANGREEALKLVLVLTDAGVGQKKIDIANAMIDHGVLPHLAQIVASGDNMMQELAAACLGNLCHESPANQDKVAKADVFKPLVDLLSKDTGVAQEAAYAIWNLTVGHAQNSERIVRLGAVPKLAELLKSSSDVAQENAAGALMHVTLSPEARDAVVEANAIRRLVDLLTSEYEPEVNTQAAGALLNLASDCHEYSQMITQAGGVEPLALLIKEGQDLAKEYAAGALMNLMRGEPEVATRAARAGAIPALASFLHRPSGQAESLGALANLASGSSERQVAIYKAQVTRKSVSLLESSDIDVRRSAAALIMNLAPQGKIKERIVEAGALRPLEKLLKDHDPAVKERAAGAFANLFNDHSGNVHAGFEQVPGLIQSLIAIVSEEKATGEAKRHGAHALAMLAAEDAPCDAVWQAGAGPPLLKLLQDGVPEAALAIMNLAWRWPDVKAELAKSGTIEYLSVMLRKGDGMSKEYAAGALMNMTAGSTDNAEACVGVVVPLVELLESESLQATEWAAGALANIVRVGEQPQKEAVEHGAHTKVAALLPKVTANGRSLVILALTALAEHQADVVRKALAGAEQKAKLRDYRDSGREELHDYLMLLLGKLGPSFSL